MDGNPPTRLLNRHEGDTRSPAATVLPGQVGTFQLGLILGPESRQMSSRDWGKAPLEGAFWNQMKVEDPRRPRRAGTRSGSPATTPGSSPVWAMMSRSVSTRSAPTINPRESWRGTPGQGRLLCGEAPARRRGPTCGSLSWRRDPWPADADRPRPWRSSASPPR